MTTIDWTLPCETTEDPPRPVWVLATDRVGICPIVIMFNNGDIVSVPLNGCGANGLRLRNVPPKPEPKPVLREAWVVWDADGYETVWCEEKDAADRARHFRGVCARAAVMSDGSPVPSEASGEESPLLPEYMRMEADRDHWKAKAEALQAEVAGIRQDFNGLNAWKGAIEARSVERKLKLHAMRPVVDAAVKWVTHVTAPNMDGIFTRALTKSVRTYQSNQSPAKPVKNCPTCRWNRTSEPACETCEPLRYSNWEPRHD